MLDLAPVLTRLRAKCVNFVDIDFAVNSREAFEDIKRFPSMYLVQGQWTGGKPNLATQAYMQQITEQFEVLTFHDARGVGVSSSNASEQLRDPVKARTDELEAALIGWSANPFATPLMFIRAENVELTPQRLVMRHTFNTSFEYRKFDLT